MPEIDEPATLGPLPRSGPSENPLYVSLVHGQNPRLRSWPGLCPALRGHSGCLRAAQQDGQVEAIGGQQEEALPTGDASPVNITGKRRRVSPSIHRLSLG